MLSVRLFFSPISYLRVHKLTTSHTTPYTEYIIPTYNISCNSKLACAKVFGSFFATSCALREHFSNVLNLVLLANLGTALRRVAHAMLVVFLRQNQVLLSGASAPRLRQANAANASHFDGGL